MAQIDHPRASALAASLLGLVLCSCLHGRDAPPEPDASEPMIDPTKVEIGVPDETGTGFVALDPGDEVAVETFGQGGNHIQLAVACTGFGNAVYPQVVIENLDGDSRIETPPYVRPQPFACDVTGRCVDTNQFVMLGGLAPVEELDGLHVRVIVRISNDEGLMDEGEIEVVLHME